MASVIAYFQGLTTTEVQTWLALLAAAFVLFRTVYGSRNKNKLELFRDLAQPAHDVVERAKLLVPPGQFFNALGLFHDVMKQLASLAGVTVTEADRPALEALATAEHEAAKRYAAASKPSPAVAAADPSCTPVRS